MVLGIRFPKTMDMAESPNSDVAAGSRINWARLTNSGALSNNRAANVGDCVAMPLRPNKYSQVRKVVFWVNCFSRELVTRARLKIGIRPTVSGTKNPFPVELPPDGTPFFALIPGGFPVLTASDGELFDKNGPTSTANLAVGTDNLETASTLLRLEFDRFDADSADFFAVWDQAFSENNYIFFYPVIEAVDGDWTSNGCYANNFSVSIVQAPSTSNRSVTIIPITAGMQTDSSLDAPTPDRQEGGFFRYVAAEWDNIVSVNLVGFVYQYANAFSQNFNTFISKLETAEPKTFSDVFTQNTDCPIAQNNSCWFRTGDFKDQLEDGAFYAARFASTIIAGRQQRPIAWIEIEQENYERTVCYHPFGTPQIVLTDHTGLFGSPSTGYFDPTWYQSFPDELILDRKIYLSFDHLNSGSQTIVGGYMDSDNESDVTSLASITLSGLSPQLSAGTIANLGIKSLFQSTFSPDPINLAGTRRLVWGLPDPTNGDPDYHGDGAIYYVLAVPASEIPEVGNVFPIGEFNPEGCASTAAGLGDPGVLVIANGSLPPKQFNPLAGVVEDAGIQPPFCNEPAPQTIVDDTAASPNGGLQQGIYRYRYTFRNCCTGKESDPNGEDIVVDTSGASPAAEVTLNFAGVRIPGDPQICEICIYRTIVDGIFPIMAKVGCFDPNITSEFVDDVSDDALDFENDPLSTLNAPPPCTPIVVELRNRLIYMGDIPQLSPAGTVDVVEGSDIVTGSFDVEWDRCMEGKYIQLEGDCRPYEILCIMPPEAGTSPAIQRLQLVEPYEGQSQTGALYTICGHPNRMWFSEPFEPTYVPASSFLDVEPGDGDRLMGAVSNFDSLIICKRRKTYVLRWRDNPVTEDQFPNRVSSDIGCISPRSFAQIESGSVWLSDRGLALYDGRAVQMVPESSNFDVFFTDPNNENYIRRDVLGRVLGAVGVFYPKRQQYLLLLPTVQTVRGCNLLMVWDTRLRNITVHKFCQEFLSMTVGRDSDGNERVYVGDTNGFVWILDVGHADGVGSPGQTGTVAGVLTAGGIDPSLGTSYLEDSSASFITGGLPGLAGLSGIAGLSAAFSGDDLGLAGVCVFFREHGAAPDALWESRTVYAATQDRLFITPPLAAGTDLTGYDYMVGPIDFRAEFKPTSFGDDDTLKRNWRQVLVYDPTTEESNLRVQMIPDFQLSDDEEGSVVDSAGETGQGRVFDLTYSKGRQVKPTGRRLYDYEQIVFTNFAPNQPVSVINHIVDIEGHKSK